MEYDISNTTKIKYFVDSLIDKVLKSAISESNKNIKANFIGRQEAIRQLEMKNINTAKEIMIKLHEFSKDKTYQDLSGLPPCINKILDKMFRLRQKLSNDENFFLCTFLGKKGYTKDDVIFIFSNAPNYNKNITDYHVKRLLAKGTMPPSCSKLATELLCFPDNLCEKYKIKSPLVYRSET
jgi:DNA primase large subunit